MLWWLYIIILILLLTLLIGLQLAKKVDRAKLSNTNYYEITIMLGSGGHTGEMCELLHTFDFNRVGLVNVLLTSNDNNSRKVFSASLERWQKNEVDKILDKTRFI